MVFFFFFSSRRRHTRFKCDWSSDVCSSDLIIRESIRTHACEVADDLVGSRRMLRFFAEHTMHSQPGARLPEGSQQYVLDQIGTQLIDHLFQIVVAHARTGRRLATNQPPDVLYTTGGSKVSLLQRAIVFHQPADEKLLREDFRRNKPHALGARIAQFLHAGDGSVRTLRSAAVIPQAWHP